MTKVKQQLLKQRETSLKTNDFWSNLLSNMWLQGDDITTIPAFEERVNKLTSKDIVDFLQKYFDVEQYVRVNLYPEK
jgi:predicted Zn-dependent peptidase